jgi:hypothetical protein
MLQNPAPGILKGIICRTSRMCQKRSLRSQKVSVRLQRFVFQLILMSHPRGGKRTFSSLFSKVKAKIQEFDQPRFASHITYDLLISHIRVRPDSNVEASGSSYHSSGPAQPDRHAIMQQSYYDPNFQSHEVPEPTHRVKGYDMSAATGEAHL